MRISGARGVWGAELHLCVLEDVVGNGRVCLSFPSEETRCEGGGISEVQDWSEEGARKPDLDPHIL